MLLAGDEFGRTQQGNNNAYCQDNEISWLDWDAIDDDGQALTPLVRRALIACARPSRCCAAAGSSPASGTRSCRSRTSPGSRRRHRDEQEHWERRRHALLWHAARRPRAGDRHPAARAPTHTAPARVNAYSDVVQFTLPRVRGRDPLALPDRHEPARAPGRAGRSDSGDVYEVTARSVLLFAGLTPARQAGRFAGSPSS